MQASYSGLQLLPRYDSCLSLWYTSCPIGPISLPTSATLTSCLFLSANELFLASVSLQVLFPLPGKFTPQLFTLLAFCQPLGLNLNITSLKRPSLNTISKTGPPVVLCHGHYLLPLCLLTCLFVSLLFPSRKCKCHDGRHLSHLVRYGFPTVWYIDCHKEFNNCWINKAKQEMELERKDQIGEILKK